MSIYNITAKKSDGGQVSLSDYKGKVLLVVNTATACGFTPQYKGLQSLYDKYHPQGFEVLDFPCNQFGNQAPGTDDEITAFCTLNYSTTFPRFAKIDVNGEGEHPLYSYLKEQKGFEGFSDNHPLSEIVTQVVSSMDPDFCSNSNIKWNFTKFLIDREGNVVARFEPMAEEAEMEAAIIKLL
ncbi:MAG: glutathione peroxidase [Clostridia bacterium]|nr:glutathione peroxidase [Clostridia bacterium]